MQNLRLVGAVLFGLVIGVLLTVLYYELVWNYEFVIIYNVTFLHIAVALPEYFPSWVLHVYLSLPWW